MRLENWLDCRVGLIGVWLGWVGCLVGLEIRMGLVGLGDGLCWRFCWVWRFGCNVLCQRYCWFGNIAVGHLA